MLLQRLLNKLTKKNKTKFYSDSEITQYSETLLSLIDPTDWYNKKKVKLKKNIQHNNPLKMVYDRVCQVKSIFNEMTQEYVKTRSDLIKQNEFNKLRAEIWKIASDSSIEQDVVIQQILNLIGNISGVSRACYNQFDGDDPYQSNLVCIYEWCDKNVRSSIGSSMPPEIMKFFLNKDFLYLTPESALDFIPSSFRKIARPLINNFAKAINLESIVIVPFYINGFLRGQFTLDICKNKNEKFELDDDLKSLIFEVVSIFSNLTSKKIAEHNLETTYKNLEKEIEERTKELKHKNETLAEKEKILEEKNSILETSLEILSHDTKNLFFNIEILFKQLSDTPIKGMLKELFTELFELMMETAGYMQSKKRIYCLSDVILRVRITNERILLPEHDRIEFIYSNSKYLFVKTSSLLKNAIINLVENALKYTEDDSKIKLILKRQDNKIVIQISDKGPGIPDEEKENILKKFYRVDSENNIDGTGRGLWITHNIIKKENGILLITDNENGGTDFTIKIPAFVIDDINSGYKNLSIWFDMPIERIYQKSESVKTMIHIQNEKPENDHNTLIFTTLLTLLREEKREKHFQLINLKLKQLKNKNPKGKKVLIVDDSLYIHYYLASFFTELGYRVIDCARNGQDGIYLYKKKKPDLVTMDNTMHIMTGIEAASKMIQFDKNAKIIFITALGAIPYFKEDLNRLLPKSNYKLITKPIKKTELLDAINSFFQ